VTEQPKFADCPVCDGGPYAYLRCQRAGCPDGRHPGGPVHALLSSEISLAPYERPPVKTHTSPDLNLIIIGAICGAITATVLNWIVG
jgi:hypothetical protein